MNKRQLYQKMYWDDPKTNCFEQLGVFARVCRHLPPRVFEADNTLYKQQYNAQNHPNIGAFEKRGVLDNIYLENY